MTRFIKIYKDPQGLYMKVSLIEMLRNTWMQRKQINSENINHILSYCQ